MNLEARKIETAISEANVKDTLETFLRNIGMLHDNEDLNGLELGGVKLGEGNFPMILTIQPRKEEALN